MTRPHQLGSSTEKLAKGGKKKIQYNAMAFILREEYVMTLWPYENITLLKVRFKLRL